jgi:TPR repeat protein
MYAIGKGVPQDNAEAMRWTRQAAKQGLSKAIVFLAARKREILEIVEDKTLVMAMWPREGPHHDLVSVLPYLTPLNPILFVLAKIFERYGHP